MNPDEGCLVNFLERMRGGGGSGSGGGGGSPLLLPLGLAFRLLCAPGPLKLFLPWALWRSLALFLLGWWGRSGGERRCPRFPARGPASFSSRVCLPAGDA